MKNGTIDPILASVIQHRLSSITQEMGEVLRKTSRSPVFNEAGDFCTGLFDVDGRMLQQSANIPIIGFGAQPALPYLMELFKDNLYPGDIIMHNDVFHGGNQTHDVGIYKPVFYQDQLIGWTVAKGHLSDLGGAVLGGYNPKHTEVWQEAIRIPGLKIVEKGQVKKDVWKTVFANVRLSAVEEDVKAMIGACNIGERAWLKLLDKYGLESFREHINYVIEATERKVKEIIRTWSNGTYYGQSYMISDGFDPLKKYPVKVKITIEDEKIRMDFTGTADQAPGYTNMPSSAAKAACAIAYLMLINPGKEVAQNDGLFSALECYFPEGSILNPRFPAATLFGNQMADVVLEAIMRALKDALPDRVTAIWSKGTPSVFSGWDPRKNEPYFDFGFLNKGGQGALAGCDGFNGIGFSGTAGRMRSQDPEMMEIKDPVFIEKYEYLPDSAGAGEFRGGYGTYLKLRIDGEKNAVGMIGDDMEYEGATPPEGIFGGRPGTLNRAYLYYPTGEVVKVGSKDMIFDVPKGTWMEHFCGGGGGYGHPYKRDVNKVVQEVIDGLLSIEKARSDYGVVLDPNTYEVDWEATRSIRNNL